MLKNRPVLIAIVSLAVIISGVSTVIFLEESISISDRAETENTNVSTIQYDFPLTAQKIEPSSRGEPIVDSPSNVELQISKMPKLNEGAQVTVTVTDNTQVYNDNIDETFNDYLIVNIPNNFQVISGLEDFIQIERDDYDHISFHKEITIGVNHPQTFDITLVASGVGEARILVGTNGDTSTSFYDLVIGENETLLKNDYYEKYPEALSAKQASDESQRQAIVEEERLEEERLLEEDCFIVKESGPNRIFCPPTPEELKEHEKQNPRVTFDTEEELREILKTDGLSDEEIEEIIREAYPKASTQSFSFLPKAYAVGESYHIIGFLTADSNQLVPTNLSSFTRMHGANACAYEWDKRTATLTELECDYTSSSGLYIINGLSLPSGSVDGTMEYYVVI